MKLHTPVLALCVVLSLVIATCPSATELGSVLGEREILSSRCEQLERQAETILTDYEQEKRDKFAAKVREGSYYTI